MPAAAPTDFQALLDAVLANRLGHVLRPWPRAVLRCCEVLAQADGISVQALLEGLRLRPLDPRCEQLLDAATISHTRFYRHHEQLDEFRHRIGHTRRVGEPIRVWSAGCSTGEEPYTLALIAAEEGVHVEVLATDVNPLAIRHAQRGLYTRKPQPGTQASGNSPDCGPCCGPWQAPEALRQSIRFQMASLVDPDPTRGAGPFDYIFCRNVLIYFAPDQVGTILDGLTRRLRPGGALVLSPVEALVRAPSGLCQVEPLGWFEHRRVARNAPAPIQPARSSPVPPKLRDAGQLIARGQSYEAEALLHARLDQEPRDSEAWMLLSDALRRRGEHTQARVAFQKATELQQGE